MKSQLIFFLVFFFAVVGFASEAVKGAKKDYENFKKEMSVKLEAVEKDLSELRAQTKTKASEAQERTLKELEESRAKLRESLNSIGDQSQSHWADFKKRFSESVEALKEKTNQVLKKKSD